MFYEIIYTVDGLTLKEYPQTRYKAEKIVAAIREYEPVYHLLSCEECRNIEAYKAGDAQYKEFLLEQSGKVDIWEVTDEDEHDAVGRVLDAPFEYDRDLAYFILCEYGTLRAANDFYREVTA